MNTTFDPGTLSLTEKAEAGTDGLRQTYIPPAISYSEALEVIAGGCDGLKSIPFGDCLNSFLES